MKRVFVTCIFVLVLGGGSVAQITTDSTAIVTSPRMVLAPVHIGIQPLSLISLTIFKAQFEQTFSDRFSISAIFGTGFYAKEAMGVKVKTADGYTFDTKRNRGHYFELQLRAYSKTETNVRPFTAFTARHVLAVPQGEYRLLGNNPVDSTFRVQSLSLGAILGVRIEGQELFFDFFGGLGAQISDLNKKQQFLTTNQPSQYLWNEGVIFQGGVTIGFAIR